jgi:hypothetical protein
LGGEEIQEDLTHGSRINNESSALVTLDSAHLCLVNLLEHSASLFDFLEAKDIAREVCDIGQAIACIGDSQNPMHEGPNAYPAHEAVGSELAAVFPFFFCRRDQCSPQYTFLSNGRA